MNTDLKKQIEERRELAKKKDIDGKATLVSRVLGNSSSSYKEGEKHSSTFKRGDLEIKEISGYERGSDGSMPFFGVTIQYLGKIVYRSGGGEIHSYIPGENGWEKILDRFYDEAQPKSIEQANERAKQAELDKLVEEQKERAKWGL